MPCRAIIVSLFAIVLLSTSAYASPDAGSISVGGAVNKPGDWTPERLKSELAADEASVSYASGGQKHTADAFPLIALLKASGVQTDLKMAPGADPKTKLHELRLVIVVQGRDGYAAVFSLAELLPALGNRPVWLAMDVDGQPLPEKDGPLRVIVPDDRRPARWVHGVASITVMDVTPPTTRPGD